MTATSLPRHLTLAAVFSIGASVLAGPLVPPVGPVAPTGKTLTELEPRIAISATNTPGDANSTFKITQSGSYYLTSNLTGEPAKHGIELAATNVTIDLNGFTMLGVAGSLNAFSASGPTSANITVRNGHVRSWGNGGVHLIDQSGSRSIVEKIHASNNGWDGISVGASSIVKDCIASDNGLSGIRTSDNGVVSNCIASNNTQSGFVTTINGTVHGCTSSNNSGSGYILGFGSALLGSTAQANSANGINVGTGSLVRDCSSYDNLGIGIVASSGSRVESCVSRGNNGAGITALSSSSIINNTCNLNGQGPTPSAGISVSSGDSRIEGNHCAGQDFGILVTGSGNLIIRNTCTNNVTNWDIAANNFFGAIINRIGVITGAVTGDAAGSTLGTSDANANFTY
jgi:parallel beta-helix repeat protein